MRRITRVEAAHGMTDAVWARHANPLSGWSRMPILPLLCLAIWARAWIGWWCLLPVSGLIAFTWANPRMFPAPASTDNWMSRAVMGERVWLAADTKPIPPHHRRSAHVLNSLAVPGLPLLAWGLWSQIFWAVAFGVFWVLVFKMWFLDRMVWLYQDAAATDPEYRAWLR